MGGWRDFALRGLLSRKADEAGRVTPNEFAKPVTGSRETGR